MLYTYPDNLVVLDGDYINFNPTSSNDVSATINRLLKEFDTLDKTKEEKI